MTPRNQPDGARPPGPNPRQAGTSCWLQAAAPEAALMPSPHSPCPPAGRGAQGRRGMRCLLPPRGSGWRGGSGGRNCRKRKENTGLLAGHHMPSESSPPLARVLSMETHTLPQPAALGSPNTSDQLSRLSRCGKECVMLGIYNTENQEIKSVLLDSEIRSEALLSLRRVHLPDSLKCGQY